MTASTIHVSKNLFQLTSVFLAQVDYTTEGAWPNFLGMLAGVRRFDDRRAMENIQQSRAARLGRHYPSREHLLRV